MSVSHAELAALIASVGAPSLQDAALATLAPLNPEPICRLCSKPLDPRHIDIGTHAKCDPRRDLGRLPAPTLGELSAALIDFNQNSARTQQTAVGPSEIGVECDRRLGYSLRNAPKRPDETVPWAPLLGTALHTLIASALAAVNEREGRQRWLIEQRVRPDPDVQGSCDAYDTDTDTVVDWKLVGRSTVEKTQRHGPSSQYEAQIQIYGRGWQGLGRDPKWVRIVYLPRWSHTIDDAYEWTNPYNREAAERALARLHDVNARLASLDVDGHPERWADVAATATSDACHFCPYYQHTRRVVGFGACPGYQSKKAQTVNDYLDSLPAASPAVG